MSFSQEAKDFISSFNTTGKFINDYQLNKARKGYYDALTDKLNKPDPVEAAFDKGVKSYKGINTDLGSDDAGKNNGPALTSPDQLDTDLGSDTAGQAKPAIAAPKSVDDVDTSLDSAGALPEYDDTNLMAAAPSEAEALTPVAQQPPGAMTGLYSSGGIVKRLRAYYGGGMVKGYADGGMVDDDEPATGAPTNLAPQTAAAPGQPDDDDPEFGYEPFPAAAGAEGGAPDQGAPAPGGEGGATPDVRLPQPKRRDTLLGMALHGSTMFLQDMFSMRDTQPQGALPVDPGAANPNGGRFMFAGLGAASKKDYDEVMKVVDPQGRLDDNIRNIAGIKAVYDYYLKRGDIDKANKAAASLVQYTRNVSAEYGGQAIEAYKRGDFKSAADLVEKGYNQIPDGNKLDVTMTRNGGGFVRQMNEDGDVIQQGPFSPEMLMQAATGMKNGSAFWQNIVASAQRQLGNQPSQAYQEALTRLYGLDANGQFGKDAYSDVLPTDESPARGEGGQGAAGSPSTTAAGAGVPGSGGAGVTSPGNPSGGEPEGPPPKPQRPAIEQPDPKLLNKMTMQEQARVVSAIDTRNRQRIAAYNDQLKQWAAAMKDYKATASRTALNRASDANYDVNPDGTPREEQGAIPDKPAVDTGEFFEPGGAAKTTDANPMGVIEEQAPTLEAPKYRRYSNDPALSEADRRANRAEVNQINRQLQSEYTAKKAEMAKARKAGTGGVKTEKRADVEANIQSALEQYQTDQPKGSELTLDQTQSRKIRSAAYGIYASNDLDSNQAIERAISLVTIDKKNPRRLNFEARDMQDGNVTVRDGGVEFKVPKQTFNELAQLRLQRVRDAEANNKTEAETIKKQAGIDERRKTNEAARQSLRGKPRSGTTLKDRTGRLPFNNTEVDSRLPDTSRLINGAGRAIAGTVKSAAKTFDKDFAKRK